MKAATAFAPASVGNVAVGFDVLGLALERPGDRVTARRSRAPGVRIVALRGLPCRLPVTAQRNTAGRAAASLLQALDAGHGVDLEIEKGIPIGSGMGGSAASAVAAVVAVNAIADEPLEPHELLAHALEGEALASGGVAHADNIAPCLYGGLTLVDGDAVTQIPTPKNLRCVVIHPDLRIETRAARAALAAHVPLPAVVDQIAALAGFLAGCYTGDNELIGRSLRDPIVEPQRAHLVPGFTYVKRAALDAGALGASLSGSGPSLFAWAERGRADAVATAMQAAFAARGTGSRRFISPLDAQGARVEVAA